MSGEGHDGSLGTYTVFCVPDSDDVKQQNNNHKTIPSRLSLKRKQRSLLVYVICVQCMKFGLEFGSHYSADARTMNTRPFFLHF